MKQHYDASRGGYSDTTAWSMRRIYMRTHLQNQCSYHSSVRNVLIGEHAQPGLELALYTIVLTPECIGKSWLCSQGLDSRILELGCLIIKALSCG